MLSAGDALAGGSKDLKDRSDITSSRWYLDKAISSSRFSVLKHFDKTKSSAQSLAKTMHQRVVTNGSDTPAMNSWKEKERVLYPEEVSSDKR